MKIIERGFTLEESRIFNNLLDISSYLCALLVLKKCIILRISWSLNEKDSYYKGKVLSLEIGVHGDAKEALKWFAFSLKFNISLLIKIGGDNGMFFPL